MSHTEGGMVSQPQSPALVSAGPAPYAEHPRPGGEDRVSPPPMSCTEDAGFLSFTANMTGLCKNERLGCFHSGLWRVFQLKGCGCAIPHWCGPLSSS